MSDKSIKSIDIFLYTLSFIITSLLLYFSNKLSLPLFIEINSGNSIVDIMFNDKDSVSIPLNLIVPLILLLIGVIILLTSLWNIIKFIIFQQDSIINKSIMGIFAILLIAILIKALINTWSLVLVTFSVGLVCILIFVLIGSLLNSSSDSQSS